MFEVTENEVRKRLAFDNPWWGEQGGIDAEYKSMPKRSYFSAFATLLSEKTIRRAIVLMGPRRVGKTVVIHQSIQALIDDGMDARRILYASLDTPVYKDLSLEKLLNLFRSIHGHAANTPVSVFFDEVQYLKDWEVGLKSLIDSFPNVRCVASGSAAAALKVKSRESGAGRFTDFLLPPLTFHEFLCFRGLDNQFVRFDDEGRHITTPSIEKLNDEFLSYLNFGGFPEAVLNEPVRARFSRYIGGDILDKVLLRDLPSLYGIADTQELNRLFTTLAYNTGNEVSLDELSKSSGVAKNTLRRYLEYLEASYLIRRVTRIDRNARHFQRVTTFKVYLTNPCLRAALFGSVESDDPAMGRIAETAVFSQLFASDMLDRIHYARWRDGEVDLVIMNRSLQKPESALEVKWSDRAPNDSAEIASYIKFRKEHDMPAIGNLVLTRTFHGSKKLGGIQVLFMPVSVFCYVIGKATIEPLLESGHHLHWNVELS